MNNLSFVFPGQGSQTVGMVAELFEQHQVIKDTFSEASEILAFDIAKLILEGPKEDLDRTENTQPALLITGVALFRLWQQQSPIVPSIMAGHSLGEYSALVCSGAMSFSDALELVRLRGQSMMQAVPVGSGAMAAILGLENHLVEQACIDAAQDQIVAAVNYNSPGQLVIAGDKDAVARAIELCKAAGAKRALPLPISVPCHCDLMKPAAEQLREALKKISISTPTISVINNVDVAIETSAEKICDALVRQLYKPVRWTETIQLMQKQGINTVLECGPGKVLSGLNRRIDRSISSLHTCDQAGFNKSLEALN